MQACLTAPWLHNMTLFLRVSPDSSVSPHRVSWVEKFVAVGKPQQTADQQQQQQDERLLQHVGSMVEQVRGG